MVLKMNVLEEVLFPLVDEMNQNMAESHLLSRSVDAILFGPEGSLDSMQLVSFVVAVEDSLFDRTGTEIILADEKAMSRRNSPFRSLAALAEYIDELRAA